jgi:hypothetical protein
LRIDIIVVKLYKAINPEERAIKNYEDLLLFAAMKLRK